jgi:RecB family exonuclease
LHTKYRQLLVAFASAAETVVSFPRGDLRRSSKRLPSRFLLPSLRDLSGDPHLAATDWDEPSRYGGALATSGSFAGELLSTHQLSTEQEWRIRSAAVGALNDAVVDAAVTMIQARASDEFTRYDGNLSAVTGLPDFANEPAAISPTALESYAECPHGFFVERLLGVHQLEPPEDILVISPLEIGNLIHQTLDELVSENAENLPGHGQAWTSGQHRRLLTIAGRKADEYAARGLTGHPRLWDPERDRIVNDVEWMLQDDDEWRAATKARVVASEMPFGMRGAAAIEVDIPGGRIRMRGSADKVDMAADGTIYVTDLKTGSQRTFADIRQEDPLVRGTKLQLPVYAYAARQRFGESASRVSASYWFVRKDRGRVTIELTDEVEELYARTLSVIVRSIAAGLFPLKAPDQPDFAWVQCDYCNPDGIGHENNRRRWERKRHDPVLRELVTLIDPDATGADA